MVSTLLFYFIPIAIVFIKINIPVISTLCLATKEYQNRFAYVTTYFFNFEDENQGLRQRL